MSAVLRARACLASAEPDSPLRSRHDKNSQLFRAGASRRRVDVENRAGASRRRVDVENRAGASRRRVDVENRAGASRRRSVRAESVPHTAMLRFLDLVCKELGADDARAEIGGRDPDDPRLVWLNAEPQIRLVSVFTAPPPEREGKLERLRQLAAGFAQTLQELQLPTPPSSP